MSSYDSTSPECSIPNKELLHLQGRPHEGHHTYTEIDAPDHADQHSELVHRGHNHDQNKNNHDNSRGPRYQFTHTHNNDSSIDDSTISSLSSHNNTTELSKNNLDIESDMYKSSSSDDIPYKPSARLKKRFTKPFLPLFLTPTFYILYILLTSMQELPITSVTWVLNNVTNLTPAQLMTYYSICFLPWMFKPIYGFLSDNFPICGYRRKSYIMISGLIAVCTFIGMSLLSSSRLYMHILGVLQSTCVCLGEVITDGLVIMYSNTLLRRRNELLALYPDLACIFTNDQLSSTEQSNQAMEIIDHDHDNIYDTLSLRDWHLLLTVSPKAAIQSEAMTVRTSASLLSCLFSLGLHLFMEPVDVIGLCAWVPLSISLTCFIIPETDNLDADGKKMEAIIDKRQNNNNNNNNTDNDDASYPLLSQGSINDQIPPSPSTLDGHKRIGKPTPATSTTSSNEQIIQSNGDTTVTPLSSSDDDDDGDEDTTAVTEKKPGCMRRIINRIKVLYGAFLLLWKPVLFVFIIRCMPSSMDPMSSYIYGELNLKPWVLSGMNFIYNGGALLGSLIYWKLFTRMSTEKVFFLTTILAAIFSLPNICITEHCYDKWFHMSDSVMLFIIQFVQSMISRINLMPSIILAAETCPTRKDLNLEATMFSVFTAFNNVASTISYAISLWIVLYFNIESGHWDHMPDLIILCAVGSLVPLYAIHLIIIARDENEEYDRIHALKEKQKLQQSKQLDNNDEILSSSE